MDAAAAAAEVDEKKKKSAWQKLAEAEAAHLWRSPSGPNLPLWVMRNARKCVIREDLTELREQFPDGVYRAFRVECDTRAKKLRSKGLSGVGVALWALAVSFFDVRPRGGVLQCEAEDLAALVGCSRATVYRQAQVLDALGFGRRRRRRRRYSLPAKDAGLTFEHGGKARPLIRWRSGHDGKLHSFVDTIGIFWATPKGHRHFHVLDTDAKGRTVEHRMRTALFHSTKARRRSLEHRLATAPVKGETAYGVEASLKTSLWGRGPVGAVENRATGPPDNDVEEWRAHSGARSRVADLEFRRRVFAERPGYARCPKGSQGRYWKPRWKGSST